MVTVNEIAGDIITDLGKKCFQPVRSKGTAYYYNRLFGFILIVIVIRFDYIGVAIRTVFNFEKSVIMANNN